MNSDAARSPATPEGAASLLLAGAISAGCILSCCPKPEFEPLLLRALEAALQGISLNTQSRERQIATDCDKTVEKCRAAVWGGEGLI